MLKNLCCLNGASGDEGLVRDYIIREIQDYCSYSVDSLGSVTARKKGRKAPKNSVMFCAHMDEVGFIVTDVSNDGYLKFRPVGGIDPRVVLDRSVLVNNHPGVIGTKAVHQLTDEEKKQPPTFKELFIDIGAQKRDEALKYAVPGDFVYFSSDYTEFGDGFIRSKALDDRIGCMLMIELIRSDLEYDTTFCFNVQEEVGLRGAYCTSYAVQSDISVILETTTAADLCGVTGGDRVCVLGDGPVVSFMDGRTVYDKKLYQAAFDTAEKHHLKIQTKTAVAGGNDAGAVQTCGRGSRVMAISLPCRYIHSAASVVKKSDIDDTRKLIKELLNIIYD